MVSTKGWGSYLSGVAFLGYKIKTQDAQWGLSTLDGM